MAVFYQIIPASIYYLPAGASYAVIFILVSRAGKLQEVLTDIMKIFLRECFLQFFQKCSVL